jgi:hypothetical protein
MHCRRNSFKDLEETINTRDFQNYTCHRSDGGKFQVSILLYRLFQAVKQHVYSGAVDPIHLRTIKDNAGPARLEERLYLVQKDLDLFELQLFGQSLDHYGGCHIKPSCSAAPGSLGKDSARNCWGGND